MLVAAFILVGVSAASVTVYMLAWLWNNRRSFRNKNSFAETQSLTIAGFAVWVVSVAAQVILYSFVLWPMDGRPAQAPVQELVERPSPKRSLKRTISTHLASVTPPRPATFLRSASEPMFQYNPTGSLTQRTSLRHSVNHVVRPVTSKTKLLLRQSSNSKDSPSLYSGRETSFDVTMEDDGFLKWDTSAVEGRNSNDLSFPNPTKRRLEPIPGSRPPSPAKPLDGPFPEEQLPESPLQSPTMSPQFETSSLRTPSRPDSRQQSNIDQSHIHPLFRTESPTPPPVASPGTVITASPFAGQVVSHESSAFPPRRPRTAHVSRSGSPRPFSPSMSRPASIKGVREPQSPFVDLHTRTSSSSLVTRKADREV